MPSYADIIKKKKKDWDCEYLMDGAKAKIGDKIPFSSPLVNWSTYGGVPRDKFAEFFGKEGGGKSTTAVDVCKHAIDIFKAEYQNKVNLLREQISNGDKQAASKLIEVEEYGPKKVLYIDLENGFDGAWAHTLGIDESDIELMQPPQVTAEEMLQTIQEIICTGEVGFIVLDSIPSLVTQKELDKKYGEATVAPLAGLMTNFMRKVNPLLMRYDCTMILINQLRDNLNNPYVQNTPGGRAVKFYSALRMEFRLGAPVDFLGNELPMKTEDPAGYLICVTVVKQKTAPFDRKNSEYRLMCQSGIRPEFDFTLLAVNKYGFIKKAGAWFNVTDPYTGEQLFEDDKPVKLHGLAKVYDYLNENHDYYEKMKKYILDDINGVTEDEPELNESL